MNVSIYYCTWKGEDKPKSHALLWEVLSLYFKKNPSACPSAYADALPASSLANVATLPACSVANANTYPAWTLCKDTAHGKPYIKELPDLHFSISHSKDFWACAIGPCPVGLDLQAEVTKDMEKIARRFFHPCENSHLEKTGFSQFSHLWAQKESYVKFTGDGLTRGLAYFSVLPDTPDSITGSVFQQDIPFADGYHMVLTTKQSCAFQILPLADH